MLTAFKKEKGGAWVVQSVYHLTLDFGSGRDLSPGIKPHVGLDAGR